MQETQVRSLVWEDPLEKDMATHSSILTWKIPWTEESGRLVHGVARVGHELMTEPPAGWYSSYQNALNIGGATHPSQSLTRGLILGAASWERDWIFCGLLGSNDQGTL